MNQTIKDNSQSSVQQSQRNRRSTYEPGMYLRQENPRLKVVSESSSDEDCGILEGSHSDVLYVKPLSNPVFASNKVEDPVAKKTLVASEKVRKVIEKKKNKKNTNQKVKKKLFAGEERGRPGTAGMRAEERLFDLARDEVLDQRLGGLGRYDCKFCSKKFKQCAALGGHISKAHPGQSDAYNHKKQVREEREKERQLHKEAMYVYKKAYGHTMQSQRVLNRNTLRRIKKTLVTNKPAYFLLKAKFSQIRPEESPEVIEAIRQNKKPLHFDVFGEVISQDLLSKEEQKEPA